MHETFEGFKKSLNHIRFGDNVVVSNEECIVFETRSGSRRTFHLHKERSEWLSSRLGTEVIFVISEAHDDHKCFIVSLAEEGTLECVSHSGFSLDIEIGSGFVDQERISRKATREQRAFLHRMEQEVWRLLIQEPSLRLAVLTGVLQNSKHDLVSLIE